MANKFNPAVIAKRVEDIYSNEQAVAANRHSEIAALGDGLNTDQIDAVAKAMKDDGLVAPRVSEAKTILRISADGNFAAIDKKVRSFIAKSNEKVHPNNLRLGVCRDVLNGKVTVGKVNEAYLRERAKPKEKTVDYAATIKRAAKKAHDDGGLTAEQIKTLVDEAFAPAKPKAEPKKTAAKKTAEKATNEAVEANDMLADILNSENGQQLVALLKLMGK